MELDTTSVIYITYITLVFGIAIYSYHRIGTAEDILVAGFELPLPLVAGSLTATLVTATYFFTGIGLGFEVGAWEGMALVTGLGTMLIVGGIVWSRPFRRLRVWTMSDYYYRRYGENTLVGVYAAVIMVIAFNVFLAAGLTAGGSYIVAAALNTSLTNAILVTAAITGAYSVLGGLWAVAYTDSFQVIFGIAGIFAGAFILFSDVGTGTLFAADNWDTSHLWTASGATFWSMFLLMAIGDLPAADIGQRVAGADSPNTARKSMIIAGVIVVIVGVLPALIGEALRPLYVNPENAERLFVHYIDTNTTAVVGGLILAAMAAAAMSTLDSVLVAGTACLIKNIYLDIINPDASDTRLLVLSRMVIGISAIVAALVALYVQQALYLATATFEIIFTTLVWPLLLGIYWRRVSARSVLASITVGSTVYLYAHLVGPPFIASVPAGIEQSISGLIVAMWIEAAWAPAVVLSGITIVIASFYFEPKEATVRAFEQQHVNTHDDTDTKAILGHRPRSSSEDA